MNKKSILALTVAGIGALATAAIFTKNNQINKEEVKKKWLRGIIFLDCSK